MRCKQILPVAFILQHQRASCKQCRDLVANLRCNLIEIGRPLSVCTIWLERLIDMQMSLTWQLQLHP